MSELIFHFYLIFVLHNGLINVGAVKILAEHGPGCSGKNESGIGSFCDERDAPSLFYFSHKACGSFFKA